MLPVDHFDKKDDFLIVGKRNSEKTGNNYSGGYYL